MISTKTRRTALAIPAVAVALTLSGAASGAAQASPKRTPLHVTPQTTPSPVLGTDGMRHLVYELVLANDGGGTAHIKAVDVRTGRGRSLLELSGDEVPAWTANFAMQGTATFGPAEGGRMWLDVPLPPSGRTPRRLVHRFTVETAVLGSPRTFVFDAARMPVSRRAAVQVGAPLRGGSYLNFNGCCTVSPHRGAITAMDGVTFESERYAMDFAQMDDDGHGGAGDLSQNANWFTFGEPVLAVADARVVSTINSVAENVPGVEPPPITFSERAVMGNSVVLALGHGHYAIYGHLQTGSVRVKPGQRVRAGQVLARVGNTGPSGAPHLHFHVADGPLPLAAEGVPFAFKRFTLDGEVSNLDEVLTGAPADIEPVAGPKVRRNQMPLQTSTISFPG